MIEMGYKSSTSGGLAALDSGKNRLPSDGFFSDRYGVDDPSLDNRFTYKGVKIGVENLPKDIFMGLDDPTLNREATKTFYKGFRKVNESLRKDGLKEIDLPEGVASLDLGESCGLLFTKDGGFAVVPLGKTNAFYDTDSGFVVMNKRNIPGTSEYKDSIELYEMAGDFIKEHATEADKEVLLPFYDDMLKSKDKSYAEKMMEMTLAHELGHKKQDDVGLLYEIFRRNGFNLTDSDREMVEKQNIRYTSNIFRKMTGEGYYGMLESDAIRGEKNRKRRAANVLQEAELHGPERGVETLEDIYSCAGGVCLN